MKIYFCFSTNFELVMITYHSIHAAHYVAKILMDDKFFFYDGMQLNTWRPVELLDEVPSYTPSMVYYQKVVNK